MSSDPSSSPDERSPIATRDEPRHTLLRAAATTRPLAEVASLVNLLKQNGESPSPADEALRLAAVSRPVDEVRQLVVLLNEPPHADGEAGTTLRAAAMGRPIEDVAQLVTIFGPESDGSPIRGPEPAGPDTSGHAWPEQRPEGEGQRADEPPATGGGVGRLAGRRPGSGPARTRRAAPALASVLRWPAAVALLAVAAIHLPTDIAGLRAGDLAAGVSLAVTVLCLVLAVMLTVQDTVWTWAASATAAVGTVVLHSLAAGFGPVHLLRDSLGRSFAGSTTTVLACAAVAAALAGSVLLRRHKPAVAATDA
ncbi:hypothetical protein [Streptomyces sp. CBMA29]|uniref:hypothetical protein n=1 Tax=Streptomyces sp. CBMA29 TaxID=1896314 RepID=UPI001661B2EF|nr:hypothetical protein [Streptomyces sp. CBMA29]